MITSKEIESCFDLVAARALSLALPDSAHQETRAALDVLRSTLKQHLALVESKKPKKEVKKAKLEVVEPT